MYRRIVQRILGLLLMVFSITMLTPVPVGLLYGDGAVTEFLLSFLITVGTGLGIWWPVREDRQELRIRDGFLVVTLFWAVLGIFGALPLWLAPDPPIGFVDSLFESMSGLTTTGATVLVGLDTLPHAILYYRQQLQWLGGMGIIVLAVAILPMLGVGGMQLFRAETPGPIKDAKLTPRITETAKALWTIYVGMTVACAAAYWLAGMSLFDAVGHSFSTVAIGGFSTHDLSMGYFNSPLIMMIAVVFMVLSAANFALHFMALRWRRPMVYLHDPEFRTYLGILATVCVITFLYLEFTGVFERYHESLAHGVFQVVSIATTTGFTTAEYFIWPGFLPVLLLFTSFIGGCAASTAGGMKVIRCLLLYKQGMREITRLVHPAAHIPVRIGEKVMSERVISAVWGFFSLYLAVFAVLMLALMATGLDQITAFSAVAACINNLGPGLGEVGANYASINPVAKILLCIAMLAGRLEVFTLLVLLTPAFWRR